MTKPACPALSRRSVLAALALPPVLAIAGPVLGQTSPSTAPGTALRRTLLDALRPSVVRDLGGPVEFVVRDIKVAGTVAFLQVEAQRPGGRPINLARTPLARRTPLSLIDGTRTEAFLRIANYRWQVVDYAIGATDVWFVDPAFCREFSAVMPSGACR